MGLYGDKLTKTDGSGVDVLTKSAGTAFDGLTKSAGTAFDGLTKSAGAISDNLIYAAPFGNLIKNSFDWNDPVGGVAAGWTKLNGLASVITAIGFNGNAQKVACGASDTADLIQDLGGILDGMTLRLKFKYYFDSDAGLDNLVIRQYPNTAPITTVSNSKSITALQVDFVADKMGGIYFSLLGISPDHFIVDEVELYAI